MWLDPVYTLRLCYPQGWNVNLAGKKGTEEDHYYFAEGECQGRVTEKFRGSNHPHRRTDETFVTNIQGFTETRDSALIMLDHQGYGRSRDGSDELYKLASVGSEKTKFRRQVVDFARHATDNEKYQWLNDAVRATSGEVRAPMGIPSDQIKQADVKLVFSVAEVVWEPPPE